MKKLIAYIFILALVLTGCNSGGDASAKTQQIVSEDTTIDLARIDGTPVVANLSGENRMKDFTFTGAENKGVLVAFWATTCTYCVAEIPHLNEFQEKYADNLKVLGVALEDISKEEMNAFLKEKGVDYEIIFGDANYDLAEAMGGVRGIPAIFLFNKDGSFHKNFVGFVPAEKLEEEIKKII